MRRFPFDNGPTAQDVANARAPVPRPPKTGERWREKDARFDRIVEVIHYGGRRWIQIRTETVDGKTPARRPVTTADIEHFMRRFERAAQAQGGGR